MAVRQYFPVAIMGTSANKNCMDPISIFPENAIHNKQQTADLKLDT